MHDVIVVGAGPVGSYTARKISEKGYDVLLLEEHSKVGTPSQCAGLVTTRVLDIVKTNSILNEIRGAEIYSPSLYSFYIGNEKVRAVVLDREKFDEELANQAIDNGTILKTDCKVKDINNSEVIVRKNGNTENYKGKYIVGADGPMSIIRKKFFSQPSKILNGYQLVFSGGGNEDFVKIYGGNEIAPGFFGWCIPSGDYIKVGLATEKNPLPFMKNLLKLCKVDGKIIGKSSGMIPLGISKKTVYNNILVVGDAAMQVKPTSGGGIYFGLRAAEHASKSLLNAIENGKDNLKDYEKMWKKDLMNELQTGYKINSIYGSLTDSEMDQIIQILSKETELINRYGDMDYPSILALKLLGKHPSLLKYMKRFMLGDKI